MTVSDVAIVMIIVGCGILYARVEQRRLDRRARFKDVDQLAARKSEAES